MNRAKFLFAGLVAALGGKAVGQSGDCVDAMTGKTVLCPGERAPLKPGEEFCPLGHAQKPNIWFARGLPPAWMNSNLNVTTDAPGMTAFWQGMNICATCGIVYVPPAKK